MGEDSLGGKKFFHKLKSAYISGRKTFSFGSPGPVINLVGWDEVWLVFLGCRAERRKLGLFLRDGGGREEEKHLGAVYRQTRQLRAAPGLGRA